MFSGSFTAMWKEAVQKVAIFSWTISVVIKTEYWQWHHIWVWVEATNSIPFKCSLKHFIDNVFVDQLIYMQLSVIFLWSVLGNLQNKCRHIWKFSWSWFSTQLWGWIEFLRANSQNVPSWAGLMGFEPAELQRTSLSRTESSYKFRIPQAQCKLPARGV